VKSNMGREKNKIAEMKRRVAKYRKKVADVEAWLQKNTPETEIEIGAAVTVSRDGLEQVMLTSPKHGYFVSAIDQTELCVVYLPKAERHIVVARKHVSANPSRPNKEMYGWIESPEYEQAHIEIPPWNPEFAESVQLATGLMCFPETDEYLVRVKKQYYVVPCRGLLCHPLLRCNFSKIIKPTIVLVRRENQPGFWRGTIVAEHGKKLLIRPANLYLNKEEFIVSKKCIFEDYDEEK